MNAKKTLPERERELQELLRSSEGQKELEELATKYEAESGRPRPHGTSVITYLLVHERGQGLLHR
ncbi:hypothetical protein AYO40_03605 [Planctomycetaceae bacterium SCGC AG-212-D15]|nr:hypothetical protein AYO40_03605 [Planctomycetaceae bacterium SCGC AG-212-D15]